MSVSLIANISKYIGVSTDAKPTGVPVGSEFFETNTRLTYICHDGTNWAQKITSPSGPTAMDAKTDPAANAATTTTIIDAYGGTVITTTAAGNSQTIGDPTITTAGKLFTVANNDTSTHSVPIVANGVTFTVAPGEAQTFIWDGTAWGPIDIGITSIPVPYNQGGTGVTDDLANYHIWVDGARTDTYTADGSLARPYKTVLAALTAINADVGKSWVVNVASGTYSDNLTITGPRYLRIEAQGGVTLSGTILINSGVGSYDRIEFVGHVEGPRAEKGPGLTISGNITCTRTNDSLIYVGFSGCYVTGDLECTTNGTWVLQYKNCRVNGNIKGTFDGLTADQTILIETYGFNEFATGTISGKTSFYNCNGTDFYGTINTTPWYENKFQHCTFAGSISIVPQVGAASALIYIDDVSYKSLLARTPTITGATYSEIDNTHITSYATTFDTNVAAAGVTLSGTTLAADGTDADIDINITPKGTGEVNISKADIDAGTIDGAVLGVTKTNIQKGPPIVTTFAGTVTAAASTTVTFSSAADAILAGYDATNPVLGVTLISNALTRYIVSWTNSTTCVVDSSVTWAGTAITSVQFPIATFVNSAGVTTGWMNAAGNVYFVGNVGLGTATPTEAADVKGGLRIGGVRVNNSGLAGFLDYLDSSGTLRIAINGKDATTAGQFSITIRESDLGGALIPFLIDSFGNILTGGLTAAGTSAAKVLAIGSGTAPTTSPADAAQMWVQDNTGQGASGLAQIYARDEYGISGPVMHALDQRDCENIIEDLSYYPPVTFTWDPGSLADGVGETSAAISVPGVSLGGAAVQCIAPYDLQGITLNAYVNAADSCQARLQNETTGTIDLASGTWTMQARRI